MAGAEELSSPWPGGPCQVCRLQRALLSLASLREHCNWSGGLIPHAACALGVDGSSESALRSCAPASASAPKNHGMWSKSMGTESSHPRLEGPQFPTCGSLLCFVLSCYVTILVTQSCVSCILFKLNSPFPETLYMVFPKEWYLIRATERYLFSINCGFVFIIQPLSFPSCARWPGGSLGAEAIGAGVFEQLLYSEDAKNFTPGRISDILQGALTSRSRTWATYPKKCFPNTFVL